MNKIIWERKISFLTNHESEEGISTDNIKIEEMAGGGHTGI
jgi:hypothetical protein